MLGANYYYFNPNALMNFDEILWEVPGPVQLLTLLSVFILVVQKVAKHNTFVSAA